MNCRICNKLLETGCELKYGVCDDDIYEILLKTQFPKLIKKIFY